MTEIIRVASNSPTTAVAGAIAGIIRTAGTVAVQAIGASAVHQAVKSVAIARLYLQEDGIELSCVPMFIDVDLGGKERTAVRIEVTGHDAPQANYEEAAPEEPGAEVGGGPTDQPRT